VSWVTVNTSILLSEGMIYFLFPGADPASFQQAKRMALLHVVRLGRDAISGYKEDADFEHSPRARYPRVQGWDEFEELASGV